MEAAPLMDWAYLAAQTGGDGALAAELLDLFRSQCATLLPSLADAATPTSARADQAHTLKGSALGIGAMRLAARADAAERSLRAGTDAEAALGDLAATARDTLAALARPR